MTIVQIICWVLLALIFVPWIALLVWTAFTYDSKGIDRA